MAFSARGAFDVEMRREVATYLQGRRADGGAAIVGKAMVLLAWLFGSWAWLVFATPGPLGSIVLAISAGLAFAGVGMAVTHDANHGAMSRRRWMNRAGGSVLDVLGASSYVWRTKHNIVHHTYANVAGRDDDLEIGPFGRLSVHHRHRAAHRLQHLYMWPLYGALHLKWAWVDDWVALATGRVARHKLKRPGTGELGVLIAGKVIFAGWAIVVPALLHPVGWVLALYALAAVVAGVTIAVVFQLAHCVEEAEFPAVADGSFAAHQLATTVDFAPTNRLVSWYVGGLNFQVEHHLFPRVSHVHYPALARIVEDVATRHGIRYRVLPTVGTALASHYRHLRSLARVSQGPAGQQSPTRVSA